MCTNFIHMQFLSGVPTPFHSHPILSGVPTPIHSHLTLLLRVTTHFHSHPILSRCTNSRSFTTISYRCVPTAYRWPGHKLPLFHNQLILRATITLTKKKISKKEIIKLFSCSGIFYPNFFPQTFVSLPE